MVNMIGSLGDEPGFPLVPSSSWAFPSEMPSPVHHITQPPPGLPTLGCHPEYSGSLREAPA